MIKARDGLAHSGAVAKLVWECMVGSGLRLRVALKRRALITIGLLTVIALLVYVIIREHHRADLLDLRGQAEWERADAFRQTNAVLQMDLAAARAQLASRSSHP